MKGIVVAAVAAAAVVGVGSNSVEASAHHIDPKQKVCQKHTAHTKITQRQCRGLWRTRVLRQARRDRVYWPSKPITVHDLKVRGVNISGFASLGRCEQPGRGAFGVYWNTPYGWTYQGGLGMYRGTHQSVGHPYSRDIGQESWQVQMLVGERVRIRYGITAWGAHACY